MVAVLKRSINCFTIDRIVVAFDVFALRIVSQFVQVQLFP